MGAGTLIALLALIVAALAFVQARRPALRPISAGPQPSAAGGDGNGDAAVRPRSDARLDHLLATVRALESRVQDHELLLCALVSEDDARHLWNIAKAHTTLYERHPGVEGELRMLVRRGFIRKRGDFKIHELAPNFDISEHFELTGAGKLLLDVRRDFETSDAKPATSLPPRAPAAGAPRPPQPAS